MYNFDEGKNARAIMRQNIQNRNEHSTWSNHGPVIRPHEMERAVDIAVTLWTGNKGNGQAADEAIAIINKGL